LSSWASEEVALEVVDVQVVVEDVADGEELGNVNMVV
jgi:hypothetical protein